MKILFAGDIHGDTKHLGWVFSEARNVDADQIIAVGDYGYWPHYGDGQSFLDLTQALADGGTPFAWLDGNHENHDLLDQKVQQQPWWHDGDLPQPIPTLQSDNFLYLPRGTVLDLDGVRLLAYGGAWSVDWMHRKAHVTWWEQELVDLDHLEGIGHAVGQVDILATHECPSGPAISYKDDLATSVRQRQYIGHLVDLVQPQLTVSGHHHVRETWVDEWSGATCHVLNRDGTGKQSVLLVDTADLAASLASAAA